MAEINLPEYYFLVKNKKQKKTVAFEVKKKKSTEKKGTKTHLKLSSKFWWKKKLFHFAKINSQVNFFEV